MLKHFLKLLFFSLIFIITIEGFARLEDHILWDAPFLAEYTFQGLRYNDPQGNNRCKPNTRYKHFRLDKNGFRITTPQKETGIKIAWLGASEAFGLYESKGHDTASQLQRELSNSSVPFNVINAACPGMNITRMQNVIENKLSKMDISYLALYITPHFYLDNIAVTPDNERKNNTTNPANRWYKLRLLPKIRDVIKSFIPTSIQDYLRSKTSQNSKNRLEYKEWHKPPQDRLELFESHLRLLLQHAKTTNAKIAILTHANSFHNQKINHSRLTAWKKFYPRAKSSVLIEFDEVANSIIRKLSEEFEITLIDTAVIVSRDAEYFADFSHFTDSGANSVAKTLSKWVTGSN